MFKKLLATIKPLLKSALLISLVVTLTLGNADGALAARSGGRIGGGSFRAPSRSYTAPSRSYTPSGGGYYPGGGIGFPFLLPFFGFGGGFGGLFTILIFIALANFLVQNFRSLKGDDGETLDYNNNTKVSVAKVQVGLLADARDLQTELNQLAEAADTGSPVGRSQVLQEASLALLRHPEYWIYAGTETQEARLALAEAKFNQLALAERSKFSEETLSNYNNLLRHSEAKKALSGTETNAEPGRYIVVTILAGTLGKLSLPVVNNTEDLRQALRQIGSISSDKLLAIEILWTPQAEGDTLSSDDMIAEYPNLKLV